jgi:hypothetical protein
LSREPFEQFILPYRRTGSRGLATTLTFHAIFNYILCVLYLGCQWKHLPIEKDWRGHREIHPTASIAFFGVGRPIAVLAPSSQASYSTFIETTDGHSWRWLGHGGDNK